MSPVMEKSCRRTQSNTLLVLECRCIDGWTENICFRSGSLTSPLSLSHIIKELHVTRVYTILKALKCAVLARSKWSGEMSLEKQEERHPEPFLSARGWKLHDSEHQNYGRTDGYLDRWMDGWTDKWMDT